MKKKYLTAYLLILAAILGAMSLSKGSVEKWRGSFIALLAPLWEIRTAIPSPADEVERLKIENRFIKAELAEAKMEKNAFLEGSKAIAAKVIFRTSDAWNSSLWINKGYEDNKGFTTIAKNSPVVIGRSIVGVIDYVGKKQSRVKLITDSSLTPSVRAVRGEKLIPLAKGELQGSSGPLWRKSSQVLRGTGFNYDFSDDKGDARDLRTGQLVNDGHSAPIALIKVQDTLVTTGMDGVFPEGWQVATVTKIKQLKEGDYFYELEAEPTAANLNELTTVFVIPPLGFDPDPGN